VIRLCIVVDGRRLVRYLTPEQTLLAAQALEQCRPILEHHALTVLFEGPDRVTHIICNRPALV
jgi:hypothetical protein